MNTRKTLTKSQRISNIVRLAAPVMLGYLAIGVPCGILESQAGLTPGMCFIFSASFYTGAGQFMLSNLLLAGVAPVSAIASITFVNTRQLLYSASFAPFFSKAGRLVSFFFAATVTDESFALNLTQFTNQDKQRNQDKQCNQDRRWEAADALLLNLFCMSAWACANAFGAVVGSVLSLPVAIASFAMTSIFVCLLLTLDHNRATVVASLVAAAGTVVCKLVGITSPAILIGAFVGLVAGTLVGEAQRA